MRPRVAIGTLLTAPGACRAPDRTHAGTKLLPIPDTINVSASCGLAVLKPASAQAQSFAEFMVGAKAQQRLESYGFTSP